MATHYRKSKKERSMEMKIITISILIAAICSVLLPYYFARLTLGGGAILTP
jgi:hypothetical protein